MDSRVKHGNDTFFSGLGNNRYGKSSCGADREGKIDFWFDKKELLECAECRSHEHQFETTENYVSKIYDKLGVKDRESACGNVKRTTFHFQ